MKPGYEMCFTTIKVRIYPDAKQIETIESTFNCCRFLWNQMLADHDEFYAASDRHFIPNPGAYKRIFPFLKAADSQAFCVVRQNLQNAFQGFFENPAKFRHPTFKKKKARQSTYSTYCHHYHGRAPDSIRIEGGGIVLPKLKWVRARLHRRPLHWWTLQYASVSKTKSGKYFCSLVYKYAAKQPEQRPVAADRAVGLKYSYRHFYTDSSGAAADPPLWGRAGEEKRKSMQRCLARMQRGSNNYRRMLQRYRLLSEHIANQRRDYIHKESRRIANAWDTVCIRSDDLAALSASLRFVPLSETAFGMFRTMLEYKLKRAGKYFVAVEAQAPTTKRCHVCGAVCENVDRRRKTWTCPYCGSVLARETNAAINIRDTGVARLMSEMREAS